MTVPTIAGLAAFTMITLSLGACSDTPTEPTPQEFIADSVDFAGYAAILAGGAHGATDSMMTRSMFISPSGAKRGSSGQFPNGTMLLKELMDPAGTVMMITAMAKCGADLMDGMCKACHSAAASTDYVFTQ